MISEEEYLLYLVNNQSHTLPPFSIGRYHLTRAAEIAVRPHNIDLVSASRSDLAHCVVKHYGFGNY